MLKPVDDTRMFGKMGVSLADAGYDVFIIGYPSLEKPVHPNIHGIALSSFQRIGFSRLLAKWRIMRKIFQLRPTVVIIGTHELLLPAVIIKLITTARIVYDVRENYYRNILHANAFPLFIRQVVAGLVRFKEKITAVFIDHFILAERNYDLEFNFHRPRFTIIENKAIATSRSRNSTGPLIGNSLHFLFSGTLAESTGVYRAIALCQEIHQLDSRATLTIIGYAAITEDRRKIKSLARQHPFIQLIGIDHLVPHSKITEQIMMADFGILAYPHSDHTINARPTKLYEYLSAGLPIILESHWPWINEYEHVHPFVFVDFSSPDYPKLLQALGSEPFYTVPPNGVIWGEEGERLVGVVEAVIGNRYLGAG